MDNDKVIQFPVKKPTVDEIVWSCDECGSQAFTIALSGVYCAACGLPQPQFKFDLPKD